MDRDGQSDNLWVELVLGSVMWLTSACMMAVAQFRGVSLGQILYGGDDLSCVEWDERSWQSRTAIREKLFWLCADAVLTL